MTAEQRSAWARLARAAVAAPELYAEERRSSGEVNRELFEATIAAVLSCLPVSEVAQAMRAGWPGLDLVDAIEDVEGYLERQAGLDRDHLRWTLAELAERSSR